MCLVTTWEKPKKSRSNRIVYKVLEVKEKRYYTYYMNVRVGIGMTYTSKLDKPEMTTINDWKYVVGIGLHSFKDKEDAMEFAKLRVKNLVSNAKLAVVGCVIPKGSLYYAGTFEGLEKSYVSDTLKYVKVLATITNKR